MISNKKTLLLNQLKPLLFLHLTTDKAGGFFTVDVTTITAMFGIFTTYLIILLQWKDPFEKDHCKEISEIVRRHHFLNMAFLTDSK